MSLFAQHGFQRTTILDICAEAGLSAGAVYSYFDSKDAIIEALSERGQALAGARADRADQPVEPLARLRAFLGEFARPGGARINQFDLRSWAESIDSCSWVAASMMQSRVTVSSRPSWVLPMSPASAR